MLTIEVQTEGVCIVEKKVATKPRGRPVKYATDAERKEAIRLRNNANFRRWYQENKETDREVKLQRYHAKKESAPVD